MSIHQILLVLLALVAVAGVAGVLIGVHNSARISANEKNAIGILSHGITNIETKAKNAVADATAGLKADVVKVKTSLDMAHAKIGVLENKAAAADAAVVQTEKAVAADLQTGAKQL